DRRRATRRCGSAARRARGGVRRPRRAAFRASEREADRCSRPLRRSPGSPGLDDPRALIEARLGRGQAACARYRPCSPSSWRSQREATEGAATRAQTETMERMADVLERVENLTERMAAVQERMDALLAQLEQREAALAAAQANQPPPAAAPSYGEPQPRPGF